MTPNDFKSQLDEIEKWYRDLDIARHPENAQRGEKTPFVSGDSAILRRAKNVDDVMLRSEAYHNLLSRVEPYQSENKNNKEIRYHRIKIAIIAGVLSHIKGANSTSASLQLSLARLVNEGKSDKSVTYRFKQLIQFTSLEDMYLPLLRMIRLLKCSVSVKDLAEDIYYWSDRIKRKWAQQFYEKINEGNKEKK